MYERGIVENINGKIISIRCGKPEQCKSCSASFCNVKTKNFTALNHNNIELNAGDSVEIYLSPGKTIFSSFMVLIFPLILFIAGYFISGAVFSTDSDALRAAGGVAGLLTGFVISFIFNMAGRSHTLPVVTEKL